ncbi:MAG: hypothetical protein JST54_24030 [Deltaproteobacteria bacterium]|nr:hypothetical protein [Deltaproteobacteria bacterium]
MRKLVLLGLVVAMGGCGDTVEPTTTTISVTTMDSAGGTIVGQGAVAGVELVMPFGALTQSTPVYLGEDPQPPDDPPGMTPASPSVLLSPEGLTLLRPATLVIPYTGLSDVFLYTAPAVDGFPWQLVDGAQPDITQNVMRGSVPHFSRWRVFRPTNPADVDGGNPDAGS